MSRRVLESVVAAVLTALALGLIGAGWSTYLAVRDLQRDVRELRQEISGLRGDVDGAWAAVSDVDQRAAREPVKKKSRP